MFDLQKLVYFTEGNTFTGSKSGPGGELLRYRVEPDIEEGLLKAWCWTEDKCFERAGDKQQKDFLLEAEGLEAVQAWLAECWPGGAAAWEEA